MITPKMAAYARSLETEACFFEALAVALGDDYPDLTRAAAEHAQAILDRHALALEEPAPREPKAPKRTVTRATRKRGRK